LLQETSAASASTPSRKAFLMVISRYPDSSGSYLQKYEIFPENHSFFPILWGKRNDFPGRFRIFEDKNHLNLDND
jgi:hypothetical protein